MWRRAVHDRCGYHQSLCPDEHQAARNGQHNLHGIVIVQREVFRWTSFGYYCADFGAVSAARIFLRYLSGSLSKSGLHILQHSFISWPL